MEELGANNWIEMYEKHDIQDKTDDSTSYAAHDAPGPLAAADPWAPSNYAQISPAQNTPAVSITHEPSRGKGKGKGKIKKSPQELRREALEAWGVAIAGDS